MKVSQTLTLTLCNWDAVPTQCLLPASPLLFSDIPRLAHSGVPTCRCLGMGSLSLFLRVFAGIHVTLSVSYHMSLYTVTRIFPVWAPALRKDFPQEPNFFPVLWPLGSGSSSHHLYGARAGSLQQLFISVLHNLPWTSVSYIEFLIWNKFSSLKKKYTLSHVAQAGFELIIKPRMRLNSCCLPPEAGITGLCHISDICGAGTIETGPLCILWKLSTSKDTCQSPNSLPTVSTNLNWFNKMLQAVWLLCKKFQEQSICLLRPWWSYPPVV